MPSIRTHTPQHPTKRRAKDFLDWCLRRIGIDLNTATIDFRGVQFTSEFMRQCTLAEIDSIRDSRVIHWGVDTDRFTFRGSAQSHPLRLLYVGQLVPHKGVHTAIEAVQLLAQERPAYPIELTIVGGTTNPRYENYLKELARASDTARIDFTGPIPRERLPEVYREHDIFVFPSAWDEPFSIALLEAMSSGLAIVGTDTGGSAEVLQHEHNALVFAKEDARACATEVDKLMDDPFLFEAIRRNRRRTVEDRFRLESTVDQIEQALSQAMKA